jgi:hypothetical protein
MCNAGLGMVGMHSRWSLVLVGLGGGWLMRGGLDVVIRRGEWIPPRFVEDCCRDLVDRVRVVLE